jgi:hypothetical protein
MNLYIVTFENGWRSAQIDIDENEAIYSAKRCYMLWFSDDPIVQNCFLFMENV